MWDGENPTLGVRIGKKKFAREKRLLSIEQLRALLGALPDRLKFIVLIQFGLGLRISETLGLKWRDIDFERRMVSIKRRWYRGDLSEEDQTKTEASNAKLSISASRLAESLPEAQKAARHASLDMTYLYSLTDTDRETAQQQKMFDALMGKSDQIQ